MENGNRRRMAYLALSAILFALFPLTAPTAGAQPVLDAGDLPLTVAEASGFTRTATYEDVWNWLRVLQSLGADIYVSTLGTTTEGREMPLVIASRPLVTTPAQAHATGKPILYLQANIHAGEVEGKDAVLILLRDMTLGGARQILDNMILLINPIYNPDGNEKWGPVERNRRGQDGPEEVGLRPNGMGLDLNRDYIKAEAPETRNTYAGILNKWRPHMFIDLHTTDGSRHGYDLTYAAPMTPTAPQGPVEFANDVMLPEIRRRVAEHGHQIFDYGNFGRGGYPPTSWQTFGWEPRYASNYVGMRGMIGILSEAVSYRPFRTRMSATYWFVREIVEFAGENAEKVVSITMDAERQIVEWGRNPASAPELGVRFELTSRGSEPVVYEVREESEDPSARFRGGRYTGELREAEMEIMTVYRPTETRPFPAGYIIPVAHPEAVSLLQRHGIVVERLEEPWSGTAEAFRVDSLRVQARQYQGHYMVSVWGDYQEVEREVPAGSYFVPTAQPLGALVFTMLEPESGDGLVTWNYFDRSLRQRGDAPVLKLKSAPSVPRSRLTKPVWP